MNKQPRMVDADKLLAWAEGKDAVRFPREDFAYADGRSTILTLLKHGVESGEFDPDPIPLPTIKPGDKVVSTRNPGFGAGTVVEGRTNDPGKTWVRYNGLVFHERTSALELIPNE